MKLYHRLASLNLGLWLIFGVLFLLATGSFLTGGEGSMSLNDMPLIVWLQNAPLAESWWLWVTVVLLAILALNTVLCSIESLRRKSGGKKLLSLLSPQVMHLGFLFIMVAHLFSSVGGIKEVMVAREGDMISFPAGESIRIGTIWMNTSPMGMPSDYGVQINGGSSTRPNHPIFVGDYGVYVKEVALSPTPAALMEIHREPGAPWALIGALFFTIGNVVLLTARRAKRE